MTRITSNLLDDTLNLIQLARETARVQGKSTQAEKLSPLVENLRSLATETRETKNANPIIQAPSLLGQEDFKSLLSAAQKSEPNNQAFVPGIRPTSVDDRGMIVSAMAMGGMGTLDIARQMGMTVDEVQMILTLSRVKSSGDQD